MMRGIFRDSADAEESFGILLLAVLCLCGGKMGQPGDSAAPRFAEVALRPGLLSEKQKG